MNHPLLKKYLAHKTVIAVTGHRDLIETDIPLLTRRVKARMQAIIDRVGSPDWCVLVTALAPGADQLVADVAIDLTIPLCVVLPMGISDYRLVSFEKQEYEPAFDRLTGLIRQADFPYCLHPESILSRMTRDIDQQVAAFVTNKHRQPDEDERQKITKTAKDQADKLPTQFLVEHAELLAGYADQLIALWDGNDNGQPGGTAHVVQMAYRGRNDVGHPLPRRRADAYAGRRLHQLVTRRATNLFPMGHAGDDDTWGDLPYGTDTQWHSSTMPRPTTRPTAWHRFWRRLRTHREPLIRYGLPAVFFVATVSVGGHGYRLDRERRVQDFADSVKSGLVNTKPANDPAKEWAANDWFRAAKFSLPDATIDTKPTGWLVAGRYMGVLFLASATPGSGCLCGCSGFRSGQRAGASGFT
jgi:hypothetical protein